MRWDELLIALHAYFGLYEDVNNYYWETVKRNYKFIPYRQILLDV